MVKSGNARTKIICLTVKIYRSIGVWNNYSDIDFALLPEQFVLKCTHDSCSVTVCTDKRSFNPSQHRSKYDNVFMKRDYYHYENKQWAYKGIKPRIIAEKYLEDEKYDSLTDYKFYCFNGTAKCVYVIINRFTEPRLNAYDMNWNRMMFEHNSLSTNDFIDKPKNFNLMIKLAEKVAKYIDNPYVRVDFYDVNGKVFFGEVTFYPDGGMGRFKPEEWDCTLGSWIDLTRGAK